MNLTDLTDVLRAHADLDGTAHEARMAGVRARVVATRRRMALTGVFCLVLALVGAVYLTLPRPVEPAQPPRSLPEYQFGARLVAQAWADLPATSVTVEFTPTAADLVVFGHCTTEEPLVTLITINGRTVVGGNCGGASSRRVGDLADYGGAAGEPLVITMFVGLSRVAGEFPGTAADLRPPGDGVTGEFAVGVGVPVPFSEYSFPPRPETLAGIEDFIEPGGVNIRADRNDPGAPRTLEMVWPGPSEVTAALDTPGRLVVSINGTVVHTATSWGYHGSVSVATVGAGEVAPGQVVTVTVVPERATGDWNVQFTGLR